MRKIYAIEALWFDNSPLSVRGLLDIVQHAVEVPVTYYQADTTDQLRSTLDRYAWMICPGDILYIATHGHPGKLKFHASQEFVELEELAEMMGKRFAGTVVFLSGCDVMVTDPERLRTFMKRTRIKALMGYTTEVNWVLGGALDMIVLQALQYFKKLRWAWKKIKVWHRDLIRGTGFVMHFPN
jgi:hypothetical protein